MLEQNPMTRVEQVALDMGRLADALEDSIGPEVSAALRYWRNELTDAVDRLLGAVHSAAR